MDSPNTRINKIRRQDREITLYKSEPYKQYYRTRKINIRLETGLDMIKEHSYYHHSRRRNLHPYQSPDGIDFECSEDKRNHYYNYIVPIFLCKSDFTGSYHDKQTIKKDISTDPHTLAIWEWNDNWFQILVDNDSRNSFRQLALPQILKYYSNKYNFTYNEDSLVYAKSSQYIDYDPGLIVNWNAQVFNIRLNYKDIALTSLTKEISDITMPDELLGNELLQNLNLYNSDLLPTLSYIMVYEFILLWNETSLIEKTNNELSTEVISNSTRIPQSQVVIILKLFVENGIIVGTANMGTSNCLCVISYENIRAKFDLIYNTVDIDKGIVESTRNYIESMAKLYKNIIPKRKHYHTDEEE